MVKFKALTKGICMKRLILTITIFSLLSSASFAQGLNEAFEDSGDYTDQERKEAKEFVHQGKKDAAMKSGCEKLKGGCDVSQVDQQGSVFGGDMGPAIEQNIGRLYGLIFGASGFMTGGGPKVKVVAKEDMSAVGKPREDGTTVKKKDKAEEKNDYCVYAAMGYELISTFIQQGLQDKIEKNLQNEKDLQLKSLLALKQTHEARKKTATYQAGIYGATSACYIARAAASQGRVVMDFSYWAKMSASGALSALYIAKAKKHDKAAKLVQTVIDGLPKAEECNPWTKTQCFCAEPTSKTVYADLYQEICVLNNGNPELPKVAMGCGTLVDGKMTFDKECKCKQTNTCFKANMKMSSVKFKAGANYLNTANKGFDLLGDGQYDAGQFDAYALNSGVYAAKIKDKVKPTNVPNLKLTAEEKKIADSLAGALPAGVAAAVAQSPSSSMASSDDGGLKAALDNVPSELKNKVAETEPVKYSKGGPGFGSTADAPEETFALPTAGGTEVQNGTEVLTFAEKAVNNADVNNAPDTPIFDIISNRYIRSGWNKLQAEEQK